MPEISAIAAALGRMAGRRAGRNKLLTAGFSAASTTLSAVSRVLHLLFLEVTGLLFLFFAVVGGGAAVREYHKYKEGVIGPGRAALAAIFALMFLWFGVTSFWRANRKQRG